MNIYCDICNLPVGQEWLAIEKRQTEPVPPQAAAGPYPGGLTLESTQKAAALHLCKPCGEIIVGEIRRLNLLRPERYWERK
jgi:hypothetical protein